ncbi:MAG: hypothetical protein VR73_04860 [Gammaproteobacteria bacterium BRH_c0]|nr:MAG: hypothetical protein VR73_04860 [Gammaproteobacteria bacterium BRH_c0]
MLHYTLMPQDSEIGSGHVVNTVPPKWFEQARIATYQPVEQRTGPNAVFGLVRSASYDYLRELWPGIEVEIRTGLHSIGNTSVVFYQEAWQEGQLAVTGKTVVVMIDRDKRIKLAFSPASREYLAGLLIAP